MRPELLLSTHHNSPPLSEDVSSLQALVREQQATLAAVLEQLKIEKLGRERAELKVKDLLRRIFGPKSERISALQGLLFGVANAAEKAAAVAREVLKRSQAAIEQVSHGGGRRAAPENLPGAGAPALSARQPGRARAGGGNTRGLCGQQPVGLAWVFLRAGAHNVIAALWQVADAASPLLMDQLYTELQAGKPLMKPCGRRNWR
jgi:hypothetical protein